LAFPLELPGVNPVAFVWQDSRRWRPFRAPTLGSVSPAQLDAALRRTRTAEEDYAKMSAIAGSEADKADVEARRRAAAESEAEDLHQTIRDLRDKLDAAYFVSAQPAGQVEAMRREIEDLKRQLQEGRSCPWKFTSSLACYSSRQGMAAPALAELAAFNFKAAISFVVTIGGRTPNIRLVVDCSTFCRV